ncbi:hypothetical protein DFH06DRAFT_1190265 [Mycena polygramma]|nr:hypothetical protein DFH06DRAFT_1190265 [Mycena polygramma]
MSHNRQSSRAYARFSCSHNGLSILETAIHGSRMAASRVLPPIRAAPRLHGRPLRCFPQEVVSALPPASGVPIPRSSRRSMDDDRCARWIPLAPISHLVDPRPPRVLAVLARSRQVGYDAPVPVAAIYLGTLLDLITIRGGCNFAIPLLRVYNIASTTAPVQLILEVRSPASTLASESQTDISLSARGQCRPVFGGSLAISSTMGSYRIGYHSNLTLPSHCSMSDRASEPALYTCCTRPHRLCASSSLEARTARSRSALNRRVHRMRMHGPGRALQ